MKRIILSILYGTIFAAVLGLLGYSILVEKRQDAAFLLKALLCVISIGTAFVVTLTGSRNIRIAANKKILYQKKFPEYVKRAFALDSKSEKKFYQAIDLYTQGNPAAALSILEKLRDHCQQGDDRYAVVTFSALCMHDLHWHQKAAEAYEYSLQMYHNSSIASNMGLCYERLGDYDRATDAYMLAIRLDPGNAFAYNNLAVLRIRQGDYEEALTCAENAVELNQRMPQALNSMAVCHYMLGNMDEYQRYFRQAVSAGSDGAKLKAYIASLDAAI